MGATEAWAGAVAGALVLLGSVYVVLLFRALRNERVIDIAIRAMKAALTDEPSPQRALLSAVTDTLAAQEDAAARIEVAVHELTLRGHQIPPPEQLVMELLDLPEPQLLITDFLLEYGGDPGSEAAFALIAADMLRAATAEVFGDLAEENLVELERLLLLAAEGRIATVALAGLDAPPDSRAPQYQAPRVADLDSAAMVAIARALDRTSRRQLRLATLLHGQAEAILRLRRDERHSVAVLMTRVWQLVRYPRVRKPGFGPGDLAALVIAFDAAGEVIDTAAECLADGEPTHAAHLLAGLRIPVPAGLPGRMYQQESLAQVRPLAVVGVWHRLAISRWVASAMQANRSGRNGTVCSPWIGDWATRLRYLRGGR
jgi:hypothetical protein